jgi:hypothetical protein
MRSPRGPVRAPPVVAWLPAASAAPAGGGAPGAAAAGGGGLELYALRRRNS